MVLLAGGAFVFAGVLPRPVAARPLDQIIPNLFGGYLATSVSPNAVKDLQTPRVADRFRGLSSSLNVARSQVPAPSATGAFRFEFDDEADTFVRRDQSLGPIIGERAQTLGARSGTFGFSYTRIDFATLGGDSLRSLTSTQPALSESFLQGFPSSDRFRAMDNMLETRLSLKLGFDLFFLTAAYGLTDDVDVSLTLSMSRAHMRGHATAIIHDPAGNEGAYFSYRQPGLVYDGSGECASDFTCAVDSFDESVFGTGDLYLRGKWHIGNFRWVDLAVAGVLTVPTGNANNLLGYHDVTFTPWLIGSKTFGRLSPHVNLGYAFRRGTDVSQAQWIAGTDILAAQWLTLAADFLGYHDDHRDGINDDIFQAAAGFKVNPFGSIVIAGTFQFPLNNDGLRADIIYSTHIEYTF